MAIVFGDGRDDGLHLGHQDFISRVSGLVFGQTRRLGTVCGFSARWRSCAAGL